MFCFTPRTLHKYAVDKTAVYLENCFHGISVRRRYVEHSEMAHEARSERIAAASGGCTRAR